MRRGFVPVGLIRSLSPVLALGACLVAAPLTAAQEPETGGVSGVVTDRSGQPIAGARVEIEGTRLVVGTSPEGRFTFQDVPAGTRTVIVERLGYGTTREAVTVTPGETTSVEIELELSAIQLDQVVVTGTAGGARVRTMGSSVEVLDIASVQELARAPDMTSLLNARAPGLSLDQSSGRLGASPSINIRGQSSLGLGNQPLVYIDGVRVNSETGLGAFGGVSLGSQGSSVRGRLNDIHPDDIESIEVIKGPAAASMYGTEASNGVIQIITKRGSTNQDPQFNMRLQYGTMHFRDAENRLPTNYFAGPEGEVLTWNAVRSEDELGRSLFSTGNTSEVHASVTGGSESIRYYASASFRDEEGVEPNNFGDQFSLHSNTEIDLTTDISLATSLNYTQIESHLGNDTGASAMLGAICGHDVVFPASRGFCLGFPPELPRELYDNSDETTRFTGSGTLTWQMSPWLSHRLLLGIDHVNSDARALERFAPDDLAMFLPPTFAAGRIGQLLRERRGVTLDYAGTATAQISPDFTSRSSVGLQWDRRQHRNSGLGGMGFPAPGIELVSATATRLDSSQSELVNTTLGAYVQQQFGWSDRLFVTGALRVDNNSAFGEDLEWVSYPKVDAAWTVSEEDFWPWPDALNTFRLRAAYGESGRAPNAFSALRTFSPVQGPGGTSGFTAGSIGNPDLRPERGKELEVGFEAMLFDRVNLDFTYFSKRTTDLIVNQPVSPSSGFSGSVPRNVGRVDNQGYELSAGLQAFQGDRVAWQVDARLAWNEDEIKDLGDLPGAVSSFGTANRVGYSIGGFWSRRVVSAELDPNTGQAVDVMCDGGPGASAVECAEAPFVYLGPSAPTTTGSLGNTLSIGNRVRLYALVDFASGHLRYNNDEHLRCGGLAGAPFCEINYFPERFPAEQVAQATGQALAMGTVDHFFQDASFAKLREVSISYAFPEGLIPRTSRASLTLAGRELATWTDFGGIDPENSGQAVLPPLTRFTATLNIGF